MKIATYNLCFLYGVGVHKHSGKDYMFNEDFVGKRIDYFAKAFTDINADILFVQELGSEEVLKRIIEKMDGKYKYFIAEPDVNGVGNAVLYRLDNCECESIPSKTNLPVFISGDQDILGSRMYSRRDFVHLKTTYMNKPIHFLGIHIKSNFLVPEVDIDGAAKPMTSQMQMADGRIRSEIFRFSQAKKIREVVDAFFEEDPLANVIVLGDVNSKPKLPVFTIIQGEIKNNPDYLIPITSRIPEEKLVDHVLVSKSLEQQVSNIEMFNKYLVEYKNSDQFPYFVESDHPAIILELK
jgi:exonuclease III